MLRCTYVIIIQNHEDNISNLVNSLSEIKGDFRKEYIFVDDGSTDESLSILKKSVNDLSRATIITQSNQGSTLSINKALNLATGDYIHFVNGAEILHPDSTNVLIKSCISLGTQVALGNVGSNECQFGSISKQSQLIEKPVVNILLGQFPNISKIGDSATLVSSDLLDKVGKADSSVYSQNMSLSLRCGKVSKFSYIPSDLSCIKSIESDQDPKFNSYNDLKSVYNFVKSNKEFSSKLIPELLKFLSHRAIYKSDKARYLIKSFISKYFKHRDLNSVLRLYKKEMEKLF